MLRLSLKAEGCSTETHHWVAGLEDFTEKNGTLMLGIRLSEGVQTAGVSDVRTVDTLQVDTHIHMDVIQDNDVDL